MKIKYKFALRANDKSVPYGKRHKWKSKNDKEIESIWLKSKQQKN